MTLHEAIYRYEQEVLPNKRQSTSKTQHLQLKWWAKVIGDIPLADITDREVVAARGILLSRGNNPATANRYVAALSAVFTTARWDWYAIPHHPIRGMRRLKEHPGRVRYLSQAEQDRLLESCRQSASPDLYDVVVVALLTAMRKGEILNLHARHVDTDGGFAMLLPTDTKNREYKVVPLIGEAREVLEVRAASGGRCFEVRCVRTAFENACRRIGLADFHFHDLRHSCASALAMTGASPLEIAEVLGHKSLSMVKRYAHLDTRRTREALERMNRERRVGMQG